MSDLIDRAALVDFMERVYRAMEADMLAADNAAYLRGYKAGLEEVRKAFPVGTVYVAAPDMAEALERLIDRYDEVVTTPDCSCSQDDHDVTVARAALAKAKGATT